LASYGGASDGEIVSRLARDAEGSVQSAAIAALCGFDLSAAARFASHRLGRSNDAEAELNEIFSAFLQWQGGPFTLAEALALAQRSPTRFAAETGLRLMSVSGRRNEQLARVLGDAAGVKIGAQNMTAAEVLVFADDVRARGDARVGAEIFRRPQLGCIACHSVNGQGGKIGPDLSTLGTAQPLEFIIGAILDPQKEIKEGFMSVEVVTEDGEEYQGRQVRETGEELVLHDVLQNKEVRLRRDAIKEKRQAGSVMPAGLADGLTRNEFRDLVRFLSELGK